MTRPQFELLEPGQLVEMRRGGRAFTGRVLYCTRGLIVADWSAGASGSVWQEGVPFAEVRHV